MHKNLFNGYDLFTVVNCLQMNEAYVCMYDFNSYDSLILSPLTMYVLQYILTLHYKCHVYPALYL